MDADIHDVPRDMDADIHDVSQGRVEDDITVVGLLLGIQRQLSGMAADLHAVIRQTRGHEERLAKIEHTQTEAEYWMRAIEEHAIIDRLKLIEAELARIRIIRSSLKFWGVTIVSMLSAITAVVIATLIITRAGL